VKKHPKATKPVALTAKPMQAITYLPVYLRKPYIPLGDGAFRANPIASGHWSGFGLTHG